MQDYVKVIKFENNVDVCFYNEEDKPFAIGEKMAEIDENAYMNGYNWEAFFNCYLQKNAPDILDGMESDPEAGMYAAYYTLSSENKQKAARFAEIICDLIENEDKIYDFLRRYGEDIEWD